MAHQFSRKKGQLPTKTCVTCARPFEWRKKWADVWENVLYCSERCRRHRIDAPRT
ncbi:MAG: DUF2256 domain-containing protein [Chloroflexi bacterium]|nr:DUF2256 domain-containing protein [Chloroflexota bacterium]